jgi:hypothetical protein
MVISEINDLDDLHLFNKKKNNPERKEREEEEKKRKDAEVANRSNNIEIKEEEIILQDSQEQVSTMVTAPGNLHNIVNRINTGKEEEDEERDPPQKSVEALANPQPRDLPTKSLPWSQQPRISPSPLATRRFPTTMNTNASF